MEAMSIGSQGYSVLLQAGTDYVYPGINERMSEVKDKRIGRCLLSLDGGGIRAFSQIAALDEISGRVKHDEGLEEWPCLADYFDMIGGVGTGGYIAILIGRMGLITPIVKEEFMAILLQALAGQMEGTQLDDWLKEFVRRHTGHPETLMFDPNSMLNHCKTFIGTKTTGDIGYQAKFRSYETSEGPNLNPPIWQALRATLSHPTLFPGMNIGPDLTNQVFISGDFEWNNPSHEVIKEFESYWKHQNVACFASIGIGREGVIQMNDINGSTVPAALNVGLDRLAVESEKIAQEIANRFQGQNTFYRLNVEHGTDRHSHGKAVTLEEVVTQTNAYLRSAGISISVDALVGSLLYPFEVVIWSTTRENFEKAMDSYIRKAKERVEKLHIAEIKAAAQEIVETLEAIRSTTSNEEHWLTLVKAIDTHLSSIPQNARLRIREPLSTTPLWDPINGYFTELKEVQINVSSLLQLGPHQIWGPPIVEPFLIKYLADLEVCFKRMESILTNDITTQIYLGEQDQELERLLVWLSPLEPRRRHEDVRASRSKGTGAWFLNTSEFQTWCNNENPQECRALCSLGKPGAGKTVICSSVIDYLREKQNDQPRLGFAFLYCDYRDQESQTGPNMIGALAKQLMRQAHSVPQNTLDFIENQIKERKTANLETIEQLFTLILQEFKVVYICVDAFDECESQLRIQLLQLFRKLSHTSLHVFLTARQSVEVEAEVTDALASLTPGKAPIVANNDDIRICLIQRISEDPYPEAMDEKLQNEVIEKIITLSQGTLLLPILQIQTVLEHDTKRDRRLALSTVPTQLFDTYAATFERIKRQPGTRPQRGLSVLTWVHLARRQLHMVELQQALAVKPGDPAFDMDGMPSDSALVDCCLGLVAIEAETSTVRLTHFTLQEYLDKHWTDLFPSGHTTIVETCITYLKFKHQVKSRWETRQSSPLIDYVACNVGHHLRVGSNPTLDQQFVAILNSEDKFQLLEGYMGDLLARTFKLDKNLATSPLHWAAYFGVVSIMKLLLESSDNSAVNAQDTPLGRTPLSYAAEGGHTETIQLLLATQSADVSSKDIHNQTPLSYATRNGHEGVVQLLLDHGAIESQISPMLTGED